jgi:hypothetical protein
MSNPNLVKANYCYTSDEVIKAAHIRFSLHPKSMKVNKSIIDWTYQNGSQENFLVMEALQDKALKALTSHKSVSAGFFCNMSGGHWSAAVLHLDYKQGTPHVVLHYLETSTHNMKVPAVLKHDIAEALNIKEAAIDEQVFAHRLIQQNDASCGPVSAVNLVSCLLGINPLSEVPSAIDHAVPEGYLVKRGAGVLRAEDVLHMDMVLESIC